MMIARRMWESDAVMARMSRALLSPASLIYSAITGIRNTLYDRGTLPTHGTPVPVISIGNLVVGGTGKTPVAAWALSELQRRGSRPALVLRGYGNDETTVHAVLNPGVPVVVNADRVAGVADAARAGANVVVLDDAFQHRRVAREADLVLVSADRWRRPVRVLPSGPWREQLSALSRASLVLITRKAADIESAAALMRQLAPLTQSGAGAVAALELAELCNVVTGEVRALSAMRGARVLVAAGIGDPASLEAQLLRAGVDATMREFPDHHDFRPADVARLARDASAFDQVICTLKDAVKLGSLWPREGLPLWYVSLRCQIESGEAEVSAIFDRVAARSQHIMGAPADRAPTTPYT